jgi:hypothetical protein
MALTTPVDYARVPEWEQRGRIAHARSLRPESRQAAHARAVANVVGWCYAFAVLTAAAAEAAWLALLLGLVGVAVGFGWACRGRIAALETVADTAALTQQLEDERDRHEQAMAGIRHNQAVLQSYITAVGVTNQRRFAQDHQGRRTA